MRGGWGDEDEHGTAHFIVFVLRFLVPVLHSGEKCYFFSKYVFGLGVWLFKPGRSLRNEMLHLYDIVARVSGSQSGSA